MLSMIESRVSVSVCETHPLMVEGLRSALLQSDLFHLVSSVKSLDEAERLAMAESPQILILDKGFGSTAVMDLVARLRAQTKVLPVVWGSALTEGEAVRLHKVGALGILRKTSDVFAILACLEIVARGGSWMEDSLFEEISRQPRFGRTTLTSREQQVLELVEQGLRNKEIANEMGICAGTVKIHLKHVFEKTGIHGRYGLALSGMRARGATTAQAS